MDVTSGALIAPFGAGVEVPLLDGVLPDMLIVPEDVPGAIFPGDAPEGATWPEETDPVGAGEAVDVCAHAIPAERMTAADASKIRRIIFILLNTVSDF